MTYFQSKHLAEDDAERTKSTKSARADARIYRFIFDGSQHLLDGFATTRLVRR